MKRLPAIIVLVLMFQLVLCSATPTISNITVTTDTNTAVVSYTVSPFVATNNCWVQYGVTSGTYLWSSVSFPVSPPIPGRTANCTVPINGLKDGTTYYFLPTARPDPDDEANICNTSGCGAVEVSAAEPPSSVSHLPAAPAALQANMLSPPDRTGYAIVPLAPTGPGGECAAAATVNAPTGYTGTITKEQTLTAIFANASTEMWYGTVFQVPQGITCVVPASDGFGHGYVLPRLAPDPCAGGLSPCTSGTIASAGHRWIIIETQQVGAADFPPFGSRMARSFLKHLGWFKGVTPLPNGLNGGYDVGGIIFQALGGGPYPTHHYLIQNLAFVTDSRPTGIYEPFLAFAHGESGDTAPFPQYMAIRDNYFQGPKRPNLSAGLPAIMGAIQGTSQGQIAIVGNYITSIYTFLWVGYAALPQVLYWQDCGNPGTCTPGGPDLVDNNYIEGMGQSIYIEVNNHATANPNDFTITHNHMFWPPAAYTYAASFTIGGCRQQIETKGALRWLIQGNYINGQWACQNTGDAILAFNAVDLTIQSNYIINSAAGFGLNGTGNSNDMTSYSSSSNRISVSNNILFNLGRSRYQAGGGGIGAPFVEAESSPSNVTITNNTVGPIGNDNPIGASAGFFYPWILYDGGGGPVAGLTVQNNILPFGIGQTNYGGGIGATNALASSGTLSHPATPVPNNSPSPVYFAGWLGTVAGYTDGQPSPTTVSRRANFGTGMQGATVIAGGSGYPNTGNVVFTGCSSSPVGTFNANKGVIQSVSFTRFGSGCDPATFTVAPAKGSGNGAVLRPAYGLTPSYVWNGNVIYCTSYQGSDMSQGNCKGTGSTMPSGDTWVQGATTALRMAAAGLVNAALSDYHCVPTTQVSCTAGANITKLESELGIVSQISAAAVGTTATISYLPPDSRVCSVDISADKGRTWTRTQDSGNAGQRSISLPGLLPSTAYEYRVLCYFDQTEKWFTFPSDSSNLATSGTFTTGGF